jgi:hypothetical protein
LAILLAFHADPKHDLLLPSRQLGDCVLKFPYPARHLRIGVRHCDSWHIRNHQPLAFTHTPPQIVDELIMQDCAQPSRQIAALAPQMLPGKRAHEASLHQILGIGFIPDSPDSMAVSWSFRYIFLSPQ